MDLDGWMDVHFGSWALSLSSPDIFFFEQISRNERFMKKVDFKHFFIAAPKKNSNNFDLANIEL